MVMVFLLIGSVACSIPYIRAASCTKANGHDAVLRLHTRDIALLGSHTHRFEARRPARDLRCGMTQEKCHRGFLRAVDCPTRESANHRFFVLAEARYAVYALLTAVTNPR